jgi:hypothetical protein
MRRKQEGAGIRLLAADVGGHQQRVAERMMRAG